MKNLKSKSQNSIIFLLASFVMVIFLTAAQTAKWTAPETAKKTANPVPSDATSIGEGKKIYESDCKKCHGKKGMGDGPNASELDKPLDPLNNASMKGQTDGEVFWKITEGRKPMPSGKKTLTEQQRWQVLNYIRTFAK
ncbi:MAG: cytochrome c [Bacteroidota bacterium]